MNTAYLHGIRYTGVDTGFEIGGGVKKSSSLLRRLLLTSKKRGAGF